MAGVAFGALALTAAPAAAQVVCENVGMSTGQGATAADTHSTACGPGASAVGAAGGAQAIGNYSFAGGYFTHADGVASVGIGGFVAVPVVGGTANSTTLADD
jgi:hypothetical protein